MFKIIEKDRFSQSKIRLYLYGEDVAELAKKLINNEESTET